MSQFAALKACQIPFKSGLPSPVMDADSPAPASRLVSRPARAGLLRHRKLHRVSRGCLFSKVELDAKLSEAALKNQERCSPGRTVYVVVRKNWICVEHVVEI